MKQFIQCVNIDGTILNKVLADLKAQKVFLVCGQSFFGQPVEKAVNECRIPYVTFSDFSPNPRYEDVEAGVEKFKCSGCDGILAIGGGSAIDVAKCISIHGELKQENIIRNVPLAAIPTTAGSGSESTSFAVVYKEGVKLSVAHDSMRPDVVLLDSSLLESLPIYQKKSTLLDALCQALESWWSVNSTKESINLSKCVISAIINNMHSYLSGDKAAAGNILSASNMSGQAINLTKTTAPHAMSYKITSLYGIPHGHAVALAFPKVWSYMLEHLDGCVDSRGQQYLSDTWTEMAASLGYRSCREAIYGFEKLLCELELFLPEEFKEEDISLLTNSVNAERLGNSPIKLSRDAVEDIYRNMLQSKKEGR